MSDRPIIFSGPMVRALLEGRKSQTRRGMKLAGRAPDFIGPRGCEADPRCWGWETPDGYFVTVEGDEKDHAPGWRNGWRDWAGAYAPGDRLWVREAWQGLTFGDYQPTKSRVSALRFKATDPLGDDDKDVRGYPWRPSIHMPRWASRITLTVTDVRVQRLQDISEEDARAEGVDGRPWDNGGVDHIVPFRDLWISLHGTESWDANPWVAALTFTVKHRNIDAAKEAEE